MTTIEHLSSSPQLWHEVHGAKIPHWITGQGPALLFVHGWPLDSRTWRNVVDRLKDDFTCHLIDLPGAGMSSWSEHVSVGIREYAEVVARVVDEIEGASVGLVAHDSGGTFARFAAALRPERIRGVVLGNTEVPHHTPWRLRFLFKALHSKRAHAVMRHMASNRMGQYLLLRDSLCDRDLMHGDFSEMFFEPLASDLERFEGALLLPTSCRLEEFDELEDVHAQITCPVHLVWGEDDPWFPLAKCRKMCAEFAGEVSLDVVPGCKLLVHEEEPEHFARQVAAHFAASGS